MRDQDGTEVSLPLVTKIKLPTFGGCNNEQVFVPIFRSFIEGMSESCLVVFDCFPPLLLSKDTEKFTLTLTNGARLKETPTFNATDLMTAGS